MSTTEQKVGFLVPLNVTGWDWPKVRDFLTERIGPPEDDWGDNGWWPSPWTVVKNEGSWFVVLWVVGQRDWSPMFRMNMETFMGVAEWFKANFNADPGEIEILAYNYYTGLTIRSCVVTWSTTQERAATTCASSPRGSSSP